MNLNFLTVREAADLVGVSQATIRKGIKEKRIDAFRVGRQLRLHAEELTGFRLLPPDPNDDLNSEKGSKLVDPRRPK